MEKLIVESNEAYNLRPGVRSTWLKGLLSGTPAHLQESILNPKPPTAAMLIGSSVHDAGLQPDVFAKYVISPKFDRRTKEGKAAAADFEASSAGKIIVDEETFRIVEGCLHSIYSHKEAKRILSSGRSEMTAAWKDSEFGIECKARPDILDGKIVGELKTCDDAGPFGFAKQVANLKYHVQAYHYLRGLTELTGETHDCFRIVAVEKKAPFAVAVYELDFSTLEKAEKLWRKAMGIYSQCVTLNEWPSYPQTIQTLSIPAWAYVGGEE